MASDNIYLDHLCAHDFTARFFQTYNVAVLRHAPSSRRVADSRHEAAPRRRFTDLLAVAERYQGADDGRLDTLRQTVPRVAVENAAD